MKKVLLLTLGVFLLHAFQKMYAQCTVSNFVATVTSVQPNPNGSGCELTVNISFTGTFNNGNKYAFVHLWESSPVNKYPNIDYTGNLVPTTAQLANSLANIVIMEPGRTNASLNSTYPVSGQGSVPVVFTGVNFTRTGPANGAATFTLAGLKVVISSCESSIGIRGDVWGSQANDGGVSSCDNPNAINYQFTNPIVYGTLDCGRPRQFSVTVDNSANTVAITASYKVYWDDGDGIYEPTTAATNNINATKDVEIYPTSGNLSIAAGQKYVSPLTGYLPYSGQNPDASHILFIQATTTAPNLSPISYNGIDIDNTCGILPVRFKSFSASRNKTNNKQVDLTWETAQEQNNKGFYLQRKTDGEWKDIGFAFSAAVGGNSNSTLLYRFKEENGFPGVSQYRLVQVDLDGRATYSEVKTVTGEAQKTGVQVFPNPAVNGKINMVFTDAGSKEVIVSDMSGRIIKQIHSLRVNSTTISGLVAGFYTIKIVNNQTGAAIVEKVIVQ